MNGRRGFVRNLAATAMLAVLAGPALAQAGKPLATVNGEPITAAEVDLILKHQPPSATPLTEAQRRQTQKAVIDMLVDEKVMKQFLRRQFQGKPGFELNSPEVTKQVAEFMAALQKEKKTLPEFLQETGQTEQQLRVDLVTRLQWKAYLAEHLTEADVKKYYEDYKPFFDKVHVHASHILLRIPASATDAERQAARTRLTTLRQQILAGKTDFAEAAKKYSDCPSKSNGGDIGFFARKFAVVEPFARVAFALKPNELSDVVETDYGIHLIKVIERSAGEPSNYDKIKGEIRNLCSQELWTDILTRAHKEARIEINLP